MPYIYKEDLMMHILDKVKASMKDYEITATLELAHINLGEIFTYEKIFNIIVVTGELSPEGKEIDMEFKQVLEKSREIVVKKLDTLQI